MALRFAFVRAALLAGVVLLPAPAPAQVPEPDWAAVAQRAAVPDLAAFRECLSTEAVARRLEEDKRLADELRVTVTPTFFYQFGMQRGYLDKDRLIELLNAAAPERMP